MPKVIVDDVEYVPISNANPNTEQIARGIMESFWGEIPTAYSWEGQANSLRVCCSDSLNDDSPTVMEVVGQILNRLDK
jgi:hypothetical protein